VNKRRARLQIRRYASLFYAPNLLSSALQLLTRGSPSSRTKSPDPLSKERDDVNKLVSDLIGGSPLATKPSSTPSVLAKSPGEVAASPAAGTPVSACKRKTKLVMEALAPVVIRPKEVEVYVKSTQTDMVSMEPQRNDDEDEDELVVEVVSAPAATEPDKVVLSFLALVLSRDLLPCRSKSRHTPCAWRFLQSSVTRLLRAMNS
jgi:hypothetical protein